MTHSDDAGLILPPSLAPIQVVIVPIYRKDEELERIREVADNIMKGLKAQDIRVFFDDDDTKRPGWKFAEHEMKGVPLRIAIGPRDLENNTAEVTLRDTKAKNVVALDSIVEAVPHLLEQIQKGLYMRAAEFREQHTYYVDDWSKFKEIMDGEGGFVWAHWDGTAETEQKIKEETKATIRCIPFNRTEEEGKCIYTGKPSTGRVIFAKAY
jgi:prolyl-tRNA synthetase